MAGQIRAQLPFGHHDYRSDEDDDAAVGISDADRKNEDTPELRVIRGYESVADAPRSADIGEVKLLYEAKRMQGRWLKNAFPEVAMGDPYVSSLLAEAAVDPALTGDLPSYRPQVVAGEISRLESWPQGLPAVPVPVLAMTTGEGGQILRLMRITDSFWTWGSDADVALQMWSPKPDDQEDESYWCRSAAPITHVKFAHHMGKTAPLRWLIVQKDTSTTILSPTYHSVPVAYQDSALEELPLAIIDTLGYWSIWNIKISTVSSKIHAQATLYKRGHPSWDTPLHGGEFGTLWYHPPPLEEWDFSQQAPENPTEDIGIGGAVPYLLDTDRNFVFAAVPITARSASQETILDVVPNPADLSQVFVLTTASLICLDICPSGEIAREVQPEIIQAFLHGHPKNMTLRMSATCMPNIADGGSIMIIIFPCKSSQVDIFWFYGTPDSPSPGQCSYQTLDLEGEQDTELDNLRELVVLPLDISRGKQPIGSEMEALFDESELQFHQLISYGRRQSLGYWICLTAKRGLYEVTAPTARSEKEIKKHESLLAKRRTRYLNYMGDKFAVPDALTNPETAVGLPIIRRDVRIEVLHANCDRYPSGSPWQVGDDIQQKLAAMKRWMAANWSTPEDDEPEEPVRIHQEVLEHTARLELLSYHLIGMNPSYEHSPAMSLPPSSSAGYPGSSQDIHSEWTLPVFSQEPLVPKFPASSQSAKDKGKATAQAEESLAAIDRLAKLAISIDRDSELARAPQSTVLSRWEDAAHDDYVPFVQLGSKAKQSRLQKKKDKMHSQLPHAQTQVPASSQAMPAFSQVQMPMRLREGEPSSSQATGPGMGFTMSQPVSGAFGQRGPVKKKKKKAGGIK
ncbi:unnamed protein product [Parascedosporium putredinis]|uniref:RNA polymerase I-specific transcription initiation factor RRN6-like protein n=1 Tax=Parascedosporium putredinis TaxID=1442378 RepID=A0A9P1H9S3_9PEZI|nr:unnamed protein product [Parascedosporium putredinis]CAI8001274.1 unnamed protein product [Parascedosporium putredinis]